MKKNAIKATETYFYGIWTKQNFKQHRYKLLTLTHFFTVCSRTPLKLFKKSNCRVFGVPLSRICINNTLPPAISATLRNLYHKGPNTEGIFRRCAAAKALKALRERVDSEGSKYTYTEWKRLHYKWTFLRRCYLRRNIEHPDSVTSSAIEGLLAAFAGTVADRKRGRLALRGQLWPPRAAEKVTDAITKGELSAASARGQRAQSNRQEVQMQSDVCRELRYTYDRIFEINALG